MRSVVESIHRHIELTSGSPVIIVSEQADSAFGTILQKEFEHATILPGSALLDGINVSESDIGIVVVVGANPSDARSLYFKADNMKQDHIPIVQVAPGRLMSTKPPSWQTGGVHYEGMFWLAAQYANTVRPAKGAYVEFGVYDGRSFVLAGHALKNVCGKFLAYDSYRGIGGSLESEKHIFLDGHYSANIETLHHNILYSNLGDLNYQVVPGFFQDTLSGRSSKDDGVGPISVVHIDVDVYEPALLALNYVGADLSDGALIMFDDFDQMAAGNDVGERRALNEWLAANPDFSVEPYRNYGVFCRSFIFHRN